LKKSTKDPLNVLFKEVAAICPRWENKKGR
jgi:hypothetical protein